MKRRSMREELDLQQEEDSQHCDAVSADNPESTISKALLNLSVKDRNAFEEEMHGVYCMAREETPEFLEASLQEFHLKLEEIDHKPAYDRAQELLELNPPGHPPSYIHVRAFKLRFLRCELFDACNAAKRYSKFIDVLFELHGETALKRPIRLSDLTREELIFLRKGHYQVVPGRDRSGRRIVCVVPNNREDIPKQVLLKVIIYLWSSILGGCEIVNNDSDQLETQRKGAVAIILPSFHTYQNLMTESSIKWLRTRLGINKTIGSIIPIRIVAVHICLPNNLLSTTIVSSIFQNLLSKWLPLTKFHFGNPLELRYQLQGYGIPTELIPATDTGNVKSGNLKHWIKYRIYIEWKAQQPKPTLYASESDGYSDYESTTSSSSFPSPTTHIVECPGSDDVIFRRGKAMNHHPGNAKFLNLIESRIHEHTIDPNTSPMRRIVIEIELIQEILDGGGRFLKWEIDKCWWVDMSTGNGTGQENDKEIQSKVHYAFRDFRKKMMRTQQKQIVTTSATYAFERQDWQKRTRYISDGNATSNDDCAVGDECISGGSDTFKF